MDARKPAPKVLKVSVEPGEDMQSVAARVNLSPTMQAAHTVATVNAAEHAEALDLTALSEELRLQMDRIKGGDLARIEAMLVAQAHTLDSLFNRLSRHAMANVGEYIKAAETYFRLALKAQAQCARTLQTLAEVKNPRPVAFISQANVGQNVQVNNAQEPVRGREKTENRQTQLLDADHGTSIERMDAGAAGAAGRGHSALAALEAFDRSPDA